MTFSTIYGKRIVALGGAMLLCGSMGFAQMHGSAPQTGQTPGQPSGQNPSMDPQMNGMQAGQPSPVDRMFVGKAMQGGLAEVQLGQLTLQKSNNPQVKEFAQRMIDDHTN